MTPTPPPTPTNPPPTPDPLPAAWLRGAGLLALLVFIGLDALDGELDADVWTYTIAILAVIYGPTVLRRRS